LLHPAGRRRADVVVAVSPVHGRARYVCSEILEYPCCIFPQPWELDSDYWWFQLFGAADRTSGGLRQLVPRSRPARDGISNRGLTPRLCPKRAMSPTSASCVIHRFRPGRTTNNLSPTERLAPDQPPGTSIGGRPDRRQAHASAPSAKSGRPGPLRATASSAVATSLSCPPHPGELTHWHMQASSRYPLEIPDRQLHTTTRSHQVPTVSGSVNFAAAGY
jgi:hypothetical protein